MKSEKKRLPVIPAAAMILLIILNIWCGLRMHRIAHSYTELKNDYSTLNGIEYGILSVNTWRDQLQVILSNEINGFSLTPEQEQKLKEEISDVLNALITKMQVMLDEQGTMMQKIVAKTVIDWDKLRSQVPEFSQTILEEIKKPENKEKLSEIASGKLNEYASETYDSIIDIQRMNLLLTKYSSSGIQDFNAKTAPRITALNETSYRLAFIMVGSLILSLVPWFFILKRKKFRQPFFIGCVILALIVLLVSLTSPMIEIDARIKQLDFYMLGGHIKFYDQVLFYRSKSILDVVRILLATHKADSVFVGILILIFSILFPIAKLISTDVYLLGNEKVRKNILIDFFAFRSGKWSMADVTVVAIFMSYVGFKGILNNQLEQLNTNTDTYNSIATNLTSLQPGFILFVSFVLFSLVLSEILKRITQTPGKTIIVKAAPRGNRGA